MMWSVIGKTLVRGGNKTYPDGPNRDIWLLAQQAGQKHLPSAEIVGMPGSQRYHLLSGGSGEEALAYQVGAIDCLEGY